MTESHREIARDLCCQTVAHERATTGTRASGRLDLRLGIVDAMRLEELALAPDEIVQHQNFLVAQRRALRAALAQAVAYIAARERTLERDGVQLRRNVCRAHGTHGLGKRGWRSGSCRQRFECSRLCHAARPIALG